MKKIYIKPSVEIVYFENIEQIMISGGLQSGKYNKTQTGINTVNF